MFGLRQKNDRKQPKLPADLQARDGKNVGPCVPLNLDLLGDHELQRNLKSLSFKSFLQCKCFFNVHE